MKKTILAIGITIFFISMSFNSISGIQIENKPINPTSRGNTLYVGGNGSGNYSKIQDAIDNASDGDTVFVYNGTYDLDNIIFINISIKLLGENKYNTILSKNGVIINASEVEIRGFTFQNCIAITTMPFFEDNIISDNIFRVEEYNLGLGGIIIFSNYSIISNNSFLNCGIIVFSYHNSIYNNTVNGKALVYFESVSDKVINDAGQVILIGCNNITIENLEVFNTFLGIELIDTVNCLISDNDFSNNAILGFLFNSSNNMISNNIFSNNEFGLIFGYCEGNKISRNYFKNNGFSLFFIESSNNHLSYNNFKYNYRSLNRNILSTKSDNTWFGNFWNRPRLLPVVLWNYKLTPHRHIPILPYSPDVDWHPAKKLNDITNIDEFNLDENTYSIYQTSNVLFFSFLERYPLLNKLLCPLK